jgi:hypothetical protein
MRSTQKSHFIERSPVGRLERTIKYRDIILLVIPNNHIPYRYTFHRLIIKQS